MRLLAEFAYLQLLDVLTTLAFLMQGVAEANPLVNWAMQQEPSPVQGLILLKAVGLVIAAYCIVLSRRRLLRKINIFFAVLVAYNLVCLILASPVLQS